MAADRGDPRGRPAALAAAPQRRGRPRDGRGDHRCQRPVRAVLEAGRGDPQPRERGPAVHRDHRRGACACSPSPSSAATALRRRRFASSAPTPSRDRPIVLRSGRFGPYVTDGTTNASLRRGDDPETLTPERAAELIADRRAAGPSKRAGARKSTGAKRPGARKAAKKAPAKKTAGAGAKATVKKDRGEEGRREEGGGGDQGPDPCWRGEEGGRPTGAGGGAADGEPEPRLDRRLVKPLARAHELCQALWLPLSGSVRAGFGEEGGAHRWPRNS